MSHDLAVACVSHGVVHHETGDHEVRDGRIKVADRETAAALVDDRKIVSWLGGEPESAGETTGSGGEEGGADTPERCGAEMSDGSICERPADECPYH